MAYATPTQFIQQFGVTEATQLLMDTERLLTADLLQAAVAGSLPAVGAGVTQAMLDAATRALTHLQDKLTTQSAYMDGYLRSAVLLPLAPNDANIGTLQECCRSLTRVSLAIDADNATERMDKLGDQWRAWLRDVAAGRVQLVRSDTGNAPASTHRVRSGQGKSNIDWDAHARWGATGGQF